MSSQPPAGFARRLAAALRRIPVKIWLRMLVLVAIFATGFVLVRFTPLGDYFAREQMIAALDRLRDSPWSPFVLLGLYVVLAPIAIPMLSLVAGGGVVFGPFWGSIYNIAGLMLGAMSAFYVAKALGKEFMEHLIGPRLRRAERMFERQGFWPLVLTRFLPLPFWLVSYGAALGGVKAPQFLVTSTLGLIPATVMHTYFIATLFRQPSWSTTALYFTCWVGLAVATGWQTIRGGLRRRQRYRDLMAGRQERDRSQ